jgi:hypothetical protein
LRQRRKEVPFKCIRTKSSGHKLVPNPDFESAVIKIQKQKENVLTASEMAAATKALKPALTIVGNENGGNNRNRNNNNKPMSMWEKLAKQKEMDLADQASRNCGSKYHNLGIVLGSAAEVECVWSHASLILSKERMNMDPILFESLMFLKFNRDYWNHALVWEAMANAQSEMKEKRLEALLNATNFNDGDESD